MILTPAASVAQVPPEPLLIGVNLAGAEFRDRWAFPPDSVIDYYISRGFTAFRVPFRWERLQPITQGEFDLAALNEFDRVTRRAQAAGITVIADMHNGSRRRLKDGRVVVIGDVGSPVTTLDFADFWRRMAQRYATSPHVWFGLINEPYEIDARLNIQNQNSAIAAIRAAGAKNKILVSGTAWSGAHSWISSGNASSMLNIHDSENNYAYDMHQYLDRTSGGASDVCVKGSGSQRLLRATAWLRQHQRRAFLGEIGVGRNEECLQELGALLDHMTTAKDAWIGLAYWAGGGVWAPTDALTIDPEGPDQVDRPQVGVLKRYMAQ